METSTLKSCNFRRRIFFLITLLLSAIGGVRAQSNSFPSNGDALVGGFNYFTTGGRVYMQYPGKAENNWSRGIISQGIHWDVTNGNWSVAGSSTTSDFSLLRFENVGAIGFFSRSSTGSSYTLDDSQLETYRRMTILTNGNVGIGIRTPAEKLAVNGTIRAKEIKVEAANWADYVFEEGYALPTLTEMERYVREHRHLPGIPDKDEVAANGVNLGEMNRKLLEKVEELTLHLIEKDKEVKALHNTQQLLVQKYQQIETLLNQNKPKQ
ncbi:hypothetical protein GCM10023231_01090 [Olivibacter ginsenosidimutans]|uniref:Uncharacterized protein n=1 Tax=Olivibacter ginsenosidimutans TaxID=1176537 RepID=A0ABP9ABI0_9SPHI